MKNLYIFLVIAALLCLSSCETPKPIRIDDGSKNSNIDDSSSNYKNSNSKTVNNTEKPTIPNQSENPQKSGYHVNSDVEMDKILKSKIIREIPLKETSPVVGIASSAKTKEFHVGYENGLIQTYKWENSTQPIVFELKNVIDSNETIIKIDCTKDGSFLGFLTQKGKFYIYSLMGKNLIYTSAFSDVVDFSFSPDSQNVAQARPDKIIIYNFKDKIDVQEITIAENSKLLTVSFAPIPIILGYLYEKTPPLTSADGKNKTHVIFENYLTNRKKVIHQHIFEEEKIEGFCYNLKPPDPKSPHVMFEHTTGEISVYSFSSGGNKSLKKVDSNLPAFIETPSIKFSTADFFAIQNNQAKFGIQIFSSKTYQQIENLNINTKSLDKTTCPHQYVFSANNDALLVCQNNKLILRSLEPESFYINDDFIDWRKLGNNNSVSQPEISKFLVNKVADNENLYTASITIANSQQESFRIKGEMKFLIEGQEIAVYPVYVGFISENSAKSRILEFSFPDNFPRKNSEIIIELSDAKGQKIPSKIVTFNDKNEESAKLQANWYFQEKYGNINSIIEPGEEGEITIDIRCLTQTTAKNVEISLKPLSEVDNMVVLSPNPKNNIFKEIKKDQVKSVTFDLETYSTFEADQIIWALDIKFDSADNTGQKENFSKHFITIASKDKIAVQKFDSYFYVLTETAYLQSSPNNSASVLATASFGTTLKITGVCKDFYLVDGYKNHTQKSIPLWIDKNFVTESKEIVKELGFDGSIVTKMTPTFSAPPVILVKNLHTKKLTTVNKSENLKFVLFADAGFKNLKIISNSIVKTYTSSELKNAVNTNINVDNKIIRAEVAYKFEVTKQNNSIELVLSDVNGCVSKLNFTIIRKSQKSITRLLAIGIDEYKDLMFPQLTNSEKGAKDFVNFVQSVKTRSNSEIVLVTGKNAKKNNIISALKNLGQKSNPQDTVIIYFAGHSGTSSQNTTEYFMVPYDADSENFVQTCISVKKLRELISKIKAKNTTFIADNINELDILDKNDSTGYEELKIDNINIILSADRNKRGGMFTNDSNPIMTYFLIKGLEGVADEEYGNSDGKISFEELVSYLKFNVVQWTTKHGFTQTPRCLISENHQKQPLIP